MYRRYAILLLAALLLAPACQPREFAEEAGYPPIFPD